VWQGIVTLVGISCTITFRNRGREEREEEGNKERMKAKNGEGNIKKRMERK